jgi:hypothetical protein
MYRTVLLSLALAVAVALPAGAQQPTREQQVRADRAKVEAEGFWIYNDLPRGIAEAKKTGKPLLVILRCVPCVACVKLDDDLVNRDPRVRPLLEQFVCVRLVSTNGLDLGLFQFDHDQSFAAFLLNADGTIYGRFGTRSHRTSWSDDVSIQGLAQALQGGLDLHAHYPQNKDALAGKRGPAPDVPTPEDYPSLKSRYGSQLNFEGNVAQSCIHCHMIGDAQRTLARERGTLPEQVLFPYPHPRSQGLILDPKERAKVLRVEKDTPAERAGFRPGDEIVRLEGQPLLSIADVQWVLHRADPEGASLKAEVRRDGRPAEVTLTLPKGWRRHDDLSWRASSWGLRRMATGGMILDDLSPEERAKAGAPATGMALRVRYLGQQGPHGAAFRAGFRQGDVLVSFDGRSDLPRETDLLAHGVTAHKAGEQVPVAVLRGGKKMELTLPMQN